MHSQLHNLFHGNVRPVENMRIEHPDYLDKEQAADMLEYEFCASLTSREQRDQYDNTLEVRGQVTLMETTQAFIDGYRLGARMMLETLGNFAPAYPSQTKRRLEV